MTSFSIVAAFDLLARGGVCVLLLLVAALLLRDYRSVVAARLGALFAFGSAAYALCSASGLHATFGPWAMPVLAISSGNNLVFWLFARALFDDGFRPRPWHAGLWLVIVAVALVWGTESSAAWSEWLRRFLALQAFSFALLAAAASLANWRDDLVEPRRRFRLFVVLAAAGHMLVTAAAAFLARGPAPLAANTSEGFVLLAIAATVTWSLLAIGGDGQLFAFPAGEVPAPRREDAVDPMLVSRLERAMVQDRLYRREGLTIGQLAHAQGLPEHRLRRLINRGLGYRNFNAFLNRYRIDDARAALADPEQAAVPVLTIALDAGFTSLGPFNRAFREQTGTTPTAFRRARLAEKAPSIPVSASRISKSA